MIAKILKYFLMISALLAFSGCVEKRIEYRDVPLEVLVPVKCVTPATVCDSNQSSYTELVVELRLCIARLRKAEEVCK
jgi:hypothetical protein